MADQLRPHHLYIMLSQAEIKALDDWRFAKRMPSRASAFRALLRQGLAADGVDPAADTRDTTAERIAIDSRELAVSYRERADELRQLAQNATNESLRSEILSLAEGWRAMADRIDQSIPPETMCAPGNDTDAGR